MEKKRKREKKGSERERGKNTDAVEEVHQRLHLLLVGTVQGEALAGGGGAQDLHPVGGEIVLLGLQGTHPVHVGDPNQGHAPQPVGVDDLRSTGAGAWGGGEG